MTAYIFLTSKTTVAGTSPAYCRVLFCKIQARQRAVLLFLPLMAALAYFVAGPSCTQPKNV